VDFEGFYWDQFNQNVILSQISVAHLGGLTLTLCVHINQTGEIK
jgi:hypothetical protein